jgi:hypothetical protein
MGASIKANKQAALALNQKASEGVDKYFSSMKSILIGGTSYTPTSLKAVLQADDDASKSVDTTRAQLRQEVATHRAAKAKARSVRAALKKYILGSYGNVAVQMLGDFGMTVPRTTGHATAEVKAKAVTRALATREARHTMGSKQKLNVKGAPDQPATVATPPQGAPAATPVQVAQASQPAQQTASHS